MKLSTTLEGDLAIALIERLAIESKPRICTASNLAWEITYSGLNRLSLSHYGDGKYAMQLKIANEHVPTWIGVELYQDDFRKFHFRFCRTSYQITLANGDTYDITCSADYSDCGRINLKAIKQGA